MGSMHDRINPYDGRLVCVADAHGEIVFSAIQINEGKTNAKRKESKPAGAPGRALQALQRNKEKRQGQV